MDEVTPQRRASDRELQRQADIDRRWKAAFFLLFGLLVYAVVVLAGVR